MVVTLPAITDAEVWLRDAPPFAVALFGAEAYDTMLGGIDEIDEPFAGLFFDAAMFDAFGRPPDTMRISDDRYAIPRSGIP